MDASARQCTDPSRFLESRSSSRPSVKDRVLRLLDEVPRDKPEKCLGQTMLIWVFVSFFGPDGKYGGSWTLKCIHNTSFSRRIQWWWSWVFVWCLECSKMQFSTFCDYCSLKSQFFGFLATEFTFRMLSMRFSAKNWYRNITSCIQNPAIQAIKKCFYTSFLRWIL